VGAWLGYLTADNVRLRMKMEREAANKEEVMRQLQERRHHNKEVLLQLRGLVTAAMDGLQYEADMRGLEGVQLLQSIVNPMRREAAAVRLQQSFRRQRGLAVLLKQARSGYLADGVSPSSTSSAARPEMAEATEASEEMSEIETESENEVEEIE
ncbi:unnamed protein product, partial [Effrenium voratum]